MLNNNHRLLPMALAIGAFTISSPVIASESREVPQKQLQELQQQIEKMTRDHKSQLESLTGRLHALEQQETEFTLANAIIPTKTSVLGGSLKIGLSG